MSAASPDGGLTSAFPPFPVFPRRVPDKNKIERNIAMKMKKVLAAALTAALVLSLAGCLNQAPSNNGGGSGTPSNNNSSASRNDGSSADRKSVVRERVFADV